ncbi:MAG: NADH-quinone oxidoreductase subunit C [Actinomycetes bacterium]
MTEFLNIGASLWVTEIAGMKDRDFIRCEWLTAVHNLENNFEVSARFSTADLSQSAIISTNISDGEIDSIAQLFPIADFHEREVAQMFGIKFRGNDTSRLAFETDFSGNPLRRDFALAKRAAKIWPGAVEPDANARRKPSLPPGVFEEWQQ